MSLILFDLGGPLLADDNPQELARLLEGVAKRLSLPERPRDELADLVLRGMAHRANSPAGIRPLAAVPPRP